MISLISLSGRRRQPQPGLDVLLLFPLTLFYLECVVKLWCFGLHLDAGIWYTLLLTVPIGFGCAFFCTLFSGSGSRRAAVTLLALATFWYLVQTVYFTVFHTFLTLDTLTMAGQAAQYWRETLTGIWRALPALLPLLLPLVLLCTLGRRCPPVPRSRGRLAALALSAGAVQLLAALVILSAGQGILSPRVLYREDFIPELAVSRFGVLTTLRLDAAHLLQSEPPSESEGPIQPEEPPPGEPPRGPEQEEPVYGPNVLALDFAALAAGEEDAGLRALHAYVDSRTPTMQNRYTGRFAGKNLIFLTAEGFWRYAVDEKLTPTLWKLTHEGFVFENFYNPLWWKSTTDGEYAACTGLIPNQSFRAFRVSAANAMPFCMGNMLRARGYPTTAYHNHTYNYYDRDITHPNMGYDYYGVGKGLEVRATWPESDLEMMEKTVPQALGGEKPFHLYYMTVSGHLNYTFTGNAMAYKHREEVNAVYPDHSEEFRAYLACNMELDRALQYLLEQLEAAGELENTVLCLSGDHYPYGLSDQVLDELAGTHLDPDFARYHSALILWSGDMEEPVTVEKPCDSLDILPTLLNLFGLPYDSRLLAGRDILADEPGLVIFSNRSFLTDLGRYDAKTDVFTPAQGAEVPEGYALDCFQKVEDLFWFSEQVLKTDYYGALGLGGS